MNLDLVLKNITDSVIITKNGIISEWSGISDVLFKDKDFIKGKSFIELLENKASESYEHIEKGKVFVYYPTQKSIKLVSRSDDQNGETIWIFHDMSHRVKIDSFMDEYYDNMYLSLNKIIEEKTKDLISINTHLEELVDERTRLLEEKNNSLMETLEKLKVTQNKLIQAEKISSLGSIIVGLAHNINTPLGVCITATSYLHETVIKDKNYGDMKNLEVSFDLLSGNLSKINNLINSMKEFTGHNFILYKEKFNMKSLVDELVLNFKEQFDKGGHNVIVDINDSINLFDYKMLYKQIFNSLLDNSLIHGLNGTRDKSVIISVLKKEEILELVVKNNGKMINSDELSRLFDPFYTTSNSSGHKGLGLSNLLAIVNNSLNGVIKAVIEDDFVIFKIDVPLLEVASSLSNDK